MALLDDSVPSFSVAAKCFCQCLKFCGVLWERMKGGAMQLEVSLQFHMTATSKCAIQEVLKHQQSFGKASSLRRYNLYLLLSVCQLASPQVEFQRHLLLLEW